MGIRAGMWGSKMSKSPSNHREFWNLFEYVEDAVINGQLTNSEVFFSSKKYVTESAYYRGTS